MGHVFITFEGPEGSGKTTQIGLLAQWLEEAGVSVVCTREPGGTPIGEQIRTVLHDLENRAMLPTTEALLYSAARAQHVRQVIRPALAQGQAVLCDRYALSTLAYQGYGHGLDLDVLKIITDFATDGLWPDLVVYLDLEVQIGLQRKRSDREAGRGEWNRMDELDLAFHRRTRHGYLEMAQQDPERWLVIDATQPIARIHQMIRARIDGILWGTTPRAAS
ncbi:MAG: dTMP kinase [Anaerolineae bacterium]|nr:dTMP kinase [Anaerolineae bacterium]